MEKLFSWKVLVSFCTVFVVSWIALQTVSNMRLEGEAELIGADIFCWNWPGENWQSRAQMTEASIISKSANDAVIKVSGKQQIIARPPGKALDNLSGQSQTVDCSAILTLYRKSNRWVLGRAEL